MSFLWFCIIILCMFYPPLIGLLVLGFLLYMMVDTFGILVLICPLLVLVTWCISGMYFDPLIAKAKKQAKEKWDAYEAIKLYCDDQDEFRKQLKKRQPKTKKKIKTPMHQSYKQSKKRLTKT